MIGIDVVISDIVDLFNNNLWTSTSNKQFYGRTWNNKDKDNNIYPEAHITGTNDYQEVMFNDNLDALCFFSVGNSEEITNRIHEVELDIIFVVNLTKLYPTINYRSVEESHNDVLQLLYNSHVWYSVTNLTKGEEAYSGLSVEQLKQFNMQPWHVFRISGLAKFEYQFLCN